MGAYSAGRAQAGRVVELVSRVLEAGAVHIIHDALFEPVRLGWHLQLCAIPVGLPENRSHNVRQVLPLLPHYAPVLPALVRARLHLAHQQVQELLLLPLGVPPLSQHQVAEDSILHLLVPVAALGTLVQADYLSQAQVGQQVTHAFLVELAQGVGSGGWLVASHLHQLIYYIAVVVGHGNRGGQRARGLLGTIEVMGVRRWAPTFDIDQIQGSQINYIGTMTKPQSAPLLQLDYHTPKTLLKMLTLLRHHSDAALRCRLGFLSQKHRRIYTDLLHKEQGDYYYQDGLADEHLSSGGVVNEEGRVDRAKGCLFPIGSYLKSQVFVEAYGRNLRKLERDCNCRVYQLGPDIFIESSVKVRPESIVFCEMMEMFIKLRFHVFYGDPELYTLCMNSDNFVQKLHQVGVEFFRKKNRRKHVAFYSKFLQPEEIRNQVRALQELQPKVIEFHDHSASYPRNKAIFQLVLGAIGRTLEKVASSYEVQLETNRKNCSLILYAKHDTFLSEPICQIKSAVSNLLVLSFPLGKARAYANKVKGMRRKSLNVNCHKSEVCLLIRREANWDCSEVVCLFEELFGSANQVQLTIWEFFAEETQGNTAKEVRSNRLTSIAHQCNMEASLTVTEQRVSRLAVKTAEPHSNTRNYRLFTLLTAALGIDKTLGPEQFMSALLGNINTEDATDNSKQSDDATLPLHPGTTNQKPQRQQKPQQQQELWQLHSSMPSQQSI